MAIKDEIDVMLNNLKNGGGSRNNPNDSGTAKKAPVKTSAARKTVYDSMSVDDLLNALTKEKKSAADEAEAKRLAEEAERAAAAEAEAKRLAEEAERAAAAEAEAKRLAEEAERAAAAEAEAKRLAEEAERAAAAEAEAKRLAEEADLLTEEVMLAADEVKAQRLSEETGTSIETDSELSDNDQDTPSNGFFSKIKGIFSKNDESVCNAPEEIHDAAPGETDFEDEAAEELPPTVEDDYINGIESTDKEQIYNAELPSNDDDNPVREMLEEIRDEAANAIADIESDKDAEPDEIAESEETEEASEPETNIDIELERSEKKGRITSALERILDEDPEEISNARSEKTEADDINVSIDKKGSGRFKRNLYAVFGIIFTILAVVGLITAVKSGILYIRSFTAGEAKMDEFTDVIYPAVIMDIDSFESPSELSSEQIISAALWSLVMSEEDMAKYEATFDVISVPAVDAEAYAARLFGSDLPELTHATVGSGELKFYYNEEARAYNVPITPITFTYEPRIKSVARNGSSYTVEVDYINELPSWLENKSDDKDRIAKTVEFRLTENNGQCCIVGMKVISVNSEL